MSDVCGIDCLIDEITVGFRLLLIQSHDILKRRLFVRKGVTLFCEKSTQESHFEEVDCPSLFTVHDKKSLESREILFWQTCRGLSDKLGLEWLLFLQTYTMLQLTLWLKHFCIVPSSYCSSSKVQYPASGELTRICHTFSFDQKIFLTFRCSFDSSHTLVFLFYRYWNLLFQSHLPRTIFCPVFLDCSLTSFSAILLHVYSHFRSRLLLSSWSSFLTSVFLFYLL